MVLDLFLEYKYLSFQYKFERVRATLESSSKRGSFDNIFSRQEFWNFENWKWEIENIFCIVCELKESENHLSTSFKKLWVGGGWVGAL